MHLISIYLCLNFLNSTFLFPATSPSMATATADQDHRLFVCFLSGAFRIGSPRPQASHPVKRLPTIAERTPHVASIESAMIGCSLSANVGYCLSPSGMHADPSHQAAVTKNANIYGIICFCCCYCCCFCFCCCCCNYDGRIAQCTQS